VRASWDRDCRLRQGVLGQAGRKTVEKVGGREGGEGRKTGTSTDWHDKTMRRR